MNLNISGKLKGSNVTSSGNGNVIEMYLGGGGGNVINVTVNWDIEDSNVVDSGNNNTLRIYLGQAEDRNSTDLPF